MKIEQAKAILITDILSKMKLKPQRKNGHEVCYFSPLRSETTPSFWVNTQTNVWTDFGDTKWCGGDSIHLVRAYLDSQLENCEVTDALRWMKNILGFVPIIRPVIDPYEQPQETSLVLRHTAPLTSEMLIKYGQNRNIPKAILSKYFEQAVIFNKKKGNRFHALSMRNDRKGYELRTPHFKSCIGKKYITFIRGTQPKPKAINIFEGAFDFLSVITQQEGQPLRHDALILHSLSNLKKASAYLKGYGYAQAYTWMDNDEPGKKVVKSWDEFCKTEEGLLHVPMNRLYYPYKDVNAAHMANLELC